jgi:hypothetical protein
LDGRHASLYHDGVETLLATAVREVFKRELLPPRALWWLAAEGMCDWHRVLANELAPHLGGLEASRARLAEMSARVFARRYDVLWRTDTRLPSRADDPAAVGLLMGGLYRVAANPDAEWIFERAGGAPKGFVRHLRAERLMRRMDAEARWREVTTHLGELLIVLTEDLPAHLPRARVILGDICFAAGRRFAAKMKRAFALEATGDAPALATEVLRMSEYLFRVNPDHWAESDAEKKEGFLEGTACPWYTAPGWNGAHCGIFGQFQAGVSAAFGLRYHLAKTIPKHGGGTCRVDLKPLALPGASLVRRAAR